MEKFTMIRDYSVYELSDREKMVFYLGGYICIFAVVYLFYHSVILSLLSGVLIKFAMPYLRKQLADKRMNRLNLQFKDMLYSLSASVASGRQMEEAIIEAEENLSTMYDEDELIMRELKHMRVSIVENKESDKLLLKDFAARSRSEDISNFVQVYITCRNMGGDLEKIIGHTTEVLTDKINIEREIRAVTSQKKTEGRIISLMPLLMLLFLNMFSYSYIEPLYCTFAGKIIMTGALAATFYGVYLMEKISDIRI